MSKELFISSSPHETKVAVLEDDLLVEVYYEHDTDVGLVGGIYKGRVSRVLPGMQSAFVDIGLERDAFLYVSDFFLGDQEEYDKVFEEAEARATHLTTEEAQPPESKSSPPASSSTSEAAAAAPPGTPSGAGSTEAASVEAPPARNPAEVPKAAEDKSSTTPPAASPGPRYTPEPRSYRRPEHRGRRRRQGRNFGERPFARPADENAPRKFEILPGESLAKYSHVTAGALPTATSAEPEVLDPNRKEREGAPVPGSVDVAASASPAQPVTSGGPASKDFAEISAQSETEAQADSRVTSERESVSFSQDEYHSFREREATSEAADFPASPDQVARTKEDSERAPAVAQPEERPHSADSVTESSLRPDLDSGPSPEALTGLSEEHASGTAASPASAPAEPETQGETRTVPSRLPGDPTERTYTLREPHQAPHYAPRRSHRGRHRGRHVRPGPRPERLRPGSGQTPQISQLLREGQEILVQIAKEPLGTKGARITSHIALPGRYLVLMPTIDHIGVSRKIASEQERLRLRNIILENKGSLPGGLIVRTAGEGRSDEEIKADLKFLSTLWNDIKTKVEHTKAPALIHRDLNLVQRVLRDTLSSDFKSLRVDNETEYERVMEFVGRCQPSLVGHVKLYTRDTPLFDEFGIQAEIEKALKPKVWLKSGGYIVINQTEALVAIDVNTGKYVGKTNRLEDTILKTNVDAVIEIVRQIRLRDLGGIIVIDFIDMDERRNRIKVVQALEEALRRDRAPTKITSFHDFGLVAITRKRVKQSLERTLCEPCNYCSGAGWVKSVSTVCYEILAEARKMAKQIEGDSITLRVSPEVARGLKSREGVLISELEAITRKDVIIKSDPAVHQERFEIF